MNLTPEQRRIIEGVIGVFETGTPDGRYDAISIFADGPHNVRQITYGRSQTTEYGNLRELIKRYVATAGPFSDVLGVYVNKIGSVPLVDDKRFKDALKRVGTTDQMKRVQDAFFDDVYFAPAVDWADAHGFTQALSMLVIYDSFIHSGSILWTIRNRFKEVPPFKGGDERKWINAYVNARHVWLGTHSRKILHATTYRTKCFRDQIARGNWALSEIPIKANGVEVR